MTLFSFPKIIIKEDGGEDSQEDASGFRGRGLAQKNSPAGPGKSTFAERVRLFQNLGKKGPKANEDHQSDLQHGGGDHQNSQQQIKPPTKKITFLVGKRHSAVLCLYFF